MTVTKTTKRKTSHSDAKEPDSKEITKSPNKLEENKESRFGPLITFPHQRVWSRASIIVGVLIYVWYTSKTASETSLAHQKEILQHRGQNFECNAEYMKEIKQFPDCIPKKCGRYVLDKLVTANEADILLRIAKRGISLGGSSGGASMLDLHSGALSYGEKFINIYSLDETKKVFNSADVAVYKIVKSKIQHAIAESFGLDANRLHLTDPTFFLRLTNVPAKTEHDEYWHVHVDKVAYESCHYTSLVHLSDYGIDFKGGRLIFVDGKKNVTVEPRKGRVTLFTSGAENSRFVEKVSSGIHYSITVSFTCDLTKSINNPVVG